MTERTLAVLHTTPVTLPLMRELIEEALPGWRIINFLDDSILPMLAQDPDSMPYVMEKLNAYCTFAQRQGAGGVLSACSSIGEITRQATVDIPVMRVDEAMMAQAAAVGKPVVLCATAATTLGPSARLLADKGVTDFERLLITEAAQRMAAEGKEAHDRCIAERLLPYLQKGCTVVLCQASMAAAKAYLPEMLHSAILTSPRSGVALAAERMHALYGD